MGETGSTVGLADGAEQKVLRRYTFGRGLVGVPTLREYLRSLAGSAWWFGLLPLAMRVLARRGNHQAFHQVERFWAASLGRFLRIKLELTGLEHIDPQQSYVVAPLHEGFADVIALLHLPLNLRFVARDELFSWRILGPFLRDTGQICVVPERGQWSYRQLLRDAGTVTQRGESIVLFPQGTILGIETDFQRGAFSLAQALGCPILPIALTGSHRVWEHPYTPQLRYGQRMSLCILPPVVIDGHNRNDVEQARIALRRELKAAALEPGMAPPRRFVPERDGYWDGYAYRIDPDFAELAAEIVRHRASVG